MSQDPKNWKEITNKYYDSLKLYHKDDSHFHWNQFIFLKFGMANFMYTLFNW